MAGDRAVSYYNGVAVVTIRCDEPTAAIIECLDRLASAVERYVDNRQ